MKSYTYVAERANYFDQVYFVPWNRCTSSVYCIGYLSLYFICILYIQSAIQHANNRVFIFFIYIESILFQCMHIAHAAHAIKSDDLLPMSYK